MSWRGLRVGVAIPAFKASEFIIGVLSAIPDLVDRIVVVDDGCPQGTGQTVLDSQFDNIQVVFHEENKGVGAATMSGFERLFDSGCDVLVKLDADGQMDPTIVQHFVDPIASGAADYVKGNRLDSADSLTGMPKLRVLGNLVLSLLSKASSGYWGVGDPTNGYFAISREAFSALDAKKLHDRYFFEQDMLFRLAIIHARVEDVPITASYGQESSNLSALKSAVTFPFYLFRNMLKRLIYQYYVRDWGPGTVYLSFGLLALLFGLTQVLLIVNQNSPTPATAGQIMLGALPTIVGFQFLVSFLAEDSKPPRKRYIRRIRSQKRMDRDDEEQS